MSDAPAPATPSVPVEIRGNALIAQPQVKLMDDQSLKALTDAIEKHAGPGSPICLIVLDLSHVGLLPSLGLGLLVQISAKCKSRQQKLKLAAVQPRVRQVFSITRLDRVFEFADSVEAALG
jgi:anti-anti-sigma factor